MFSASSDDELRGLYWFMADYHGGQWSRGYRILCLAGRRLNRVYGTRDPMDLPLGVKGTAIYAALESRYANKV